MTEDELLEKYGKSKLAYSSVYKYELIANGITDKEDKIKAVIDLQECYRTEFDLNSTFSLEDFPVSAVYINGNIIY